MSKLDYEHWTQCKKCKEIVNHEKELMYGKCARCYSEEMRDLAIHMANSLRKGKK